MSELIYQWIDFLWVPLGFFVVHKHQRWITALFIATCLFTLRLQVDIMERVGFDHGVLDLMNSRLHNRGVIIYSIIILLFLALAHYSPRTQTIIFFAASLSIYIFALCFSMIMMIF